MKRFPLLAACCIAAISLSLASCAVEQEVEVTSTTLPTDEVIAKNIEQLLAGASVDGRSAATFAEVSDVEIVGKFAVEDQRDYQIYASLQCKINDGPEAEPVVEHQPDKITLQRLDTNKWVLRYEAGSQSRWRIVKE
ncbi:MAG: hypothetical protein NXI22_05075 [bacterium]|nr:hypothetical protein [bacterium]